MNCVQPTDGLTAHVSCLVGRVLNKVTSEELTGENVRSRVVTWDNSSLCQLQWKHSEAEDHSKHAHSQNVLFKVWRILPKCWQRKTHYLQHEQFSDSQTIISASEMIYKPQSICRLRPTTINSHQHERHRVKLGGLRLKAWLMQETDILGLPHI